MTTKLTLIQGDCMEVLPKMPDASVDLVVTDPPYFNIMKSDWRGKKYDWDDWKSRDDYLNFLRKVFIQIKRILKPTGSLYVFQDDKNVAYVQIELENLGFYLENHIVWYKRNNMTIKGWQNYRCFTPVTERILFFSRDFRTNNLKDLTPEQIEIFSPIVEYFIEEKRKIKEIMGFKTDKEFNEFINKVTETKSVASRHYFSYSQFCFPTKEMYTKLQSINNIIEKDCVFKKEYETLKKEYEESRRYFNQDENYTDVWEIPIIGGNENVNHPTQKPIKLIKRIIKTSSKENATVLDPFLGSGTTMKACLELNRNCIGIEINPKYIKLTKNRLNWGYSLGDIEFEFYEFEKPKDNQAPR